MTSHPRNRMCQAQDHVSFERCYLCRKLQKYTLLGTQEVIPTFDDVLALVGGKVPMIVELKPNRRITSLSRKVYETLSRYKGPYCVESFHPLALGWYRKNAPEVIRGQLSSGHLSDNGHWMRDRALKYLLLNVLSRPDFVAYDLHTDRHASMALMRRVFRPLLVAWTVRTQQESREAAGRYDLQIFEGITPED